MNAADMDYFVLCRRTDPTYDASCALRDYLCRNPDVSGDLIYELDIYSDEIPMDFSGLQDYLNSIDGIEAFDLGRNSHDCEINNHDWFVLTTYGIESLSQDRYEKLCVRLVLEHADQILGGKVAIPQELREVLDLWGDNGIELCKKYPCKYLNVRPASNRTSAKPKAKPKKTVSKPVQKSSNRRPSASKKPTVRTKAPVKAKPAKRSKR